MSDGISVCLIAKNCADSLRQCLKSLKPFLRYDLGDEVVVVDTGSNDHTPEVAEAAGARVFRHPELNVAGMHDLVKQYLPDNHDELSKDPQFADGFLSDFAAARQLSTDYAKNDLVFWLDSDDVLAGGSALRALALDFFKDPKNSCLFLPYDYSFDTDGQCNTVLWRERILRKASFVWKGRCHESMIPRTGKPTTVQKCSNSACRIVHRNGRHHTFSDIRNYAILRKEYDEADWKDPRTEFYLGNACRGLKRWTEAIQWYSKTLERSGSRDDRLSACLNIGYCYTMFGRPWRAIDWFNQALKIHPTEPRAFYAVARCHYDLQRWNDCVVWTQLGRALGTPEHITSVDPQSFDFYPAIFECLSLKQLGQKQAALQAAQAALQLRPTFTAARELFQEIMQWAQKESLKEAVQATMQCAFSPTAAKEIVTRLRPELRKSIRDFHLETACTKPSKSITFFCGKTVEPWDPTCEATGVGGSEKMVIHLARKFASKGWRVDVYGNPKDENFYKSFDRVTYRPAESFNPELERDILILWRSPSLLDYPFKARKIFIDMHDVADDSAFTPERMAKCAGVFWKSKFHRSTAPSCPEDKCIYSRNGIDLTHFNDPAVVKDLHPDQKFIAPVRSLKKIVWCSSADRGLLGTLTAWSRIYNEFPDAEFHTFYGFTPMYIKVAAEREYQHFGDLQGEHHMLDYAERCYGLMDRLNVKHHGRVGHKELAAELSTAGIWIYPTKFPEISCMSAMEAQAAGAFPICSDTGALKETVQYGTVVDPLSPDQIVQAIRGVFAKGHDLDDYRTDMQAWARDAFNLDTLADEWLSHFSAEKLVEVA